MLQEEHLQWSMGAMFLKYIISKSHIGTNTTINMVHFWLLNLPRTMENMNSNIAEFNLFVEQQIIEFAARGQTTYDLLVNLFQAYKMANDKDFREYIKSKEREINKGTKVELQLLMCLVLNEYKWSCEAET